MRALVYTGTQLSEIRDVPTPVCDREQVVVDLAFCGICGSDMHAWHGHDERRVPPLVLGHEAVGVANDGPLQGQRVAINPLMACGACVSCLSGNEHLCAERELIGMRVPGAFAEKVAIKAQNLTTLPGDGCELARGALVCRGRSRGEGNLAEKKGSMVEHLLTLFLPHTRCQFNKLSVT